MALDQFKKTKAAASRFFTTRRKWKTLGYSVKALSIATFLMVASLPIQIARDKAYVEAAGNLIARNLPQTAAEAKGFIYGQGGIPSAPWAPEERLALGHAAYFFLLRDGSAWRMGGDEWSRGMEADLAGLSTESPASPKLPAFQVLEGMPAWVESFSLDYGRLFIFRTFPWVVGYVWAFFFVLLLLMALSLPLIVRKLQIRIQMIPNFLRRQIILYTVASLLPAGFFCLVFVGAAIVGQTMGIHWFHSNWELLFLVCGFLVLMTWSMFVAARDLNHRINDSLLVLTNGMEMASNLDFDHPIIPIAHDEIGLVAEVFNQVTHLLKTRISVLQAIFHNLRIFSGLLEAEKVLDHSLKTFKSLEEASGVAIALWDEDAREMVVERVSDDRPETVGLRFPEGEGIFGRIIQEPQLLVFPKEEYSRIAAGCANEARLWGKPDFAVAIPMILKGELKGAVALYDMKFGDFELEVKRDYLQGLANQIAIFLENARLYGLVIRDHLTGLYTHSFVEAEMEELLKQAKRYSFSFAFIMLDMDRFKQINDQYGHPAGNQVLKALVQTMHSVSRDSDLLARYGGDEFEILLPHTDKEGALAYTEKLRKAVEEMEIEIADGIKVRVTISVGLAVYPKDGGTAEDIQTAADKALYGAKALGRNCIVTYEGASSQKTNSESTKSLP